MLMFVVQFDMPKIVRCTACIQGLARFFAASPDISEPIRLSSLSGSKLVRA